MKVPTYFIPGIRSRKFSTCCVARIRVGARTATCSKENNVVQSYQSYKIENKYFLDHEIPLTTRHSATIIINIHHWLKICNMQSIPDSPPAQHDKQCEWLLQSCRSLRPHTPVGPSVRCGLSYRRQFPVVCIETIGTTECKVEHRETVSSLHRYELQVWNQGLSELTSKQACWSFVAVCLNCFSNNRYSSPSGGYGVR